MQGLVRSLQAARSAAPQAGRQAQARLSSSAAEAPRGSDSNPWPTLQQAVQTNLKHYNDGWAVHAGLRRTPFFRSKDLRRKLQTRLSLSREMFEYGISVPPPQFGYTYWLGKALRITMWSWIAWRLYDIGQDRLGVYYPWDIGHHGHHDEHHEENHEEHHEELHGEHQGHGNAHSH